MGGNCCSLNDESEMESDMHEQKLLNEFKNDEKYNENDIKEELPLTMEKSISADQDSLLNAFEKSIINKDFLNAMAIFEQYSNIDFIDYELSNGDKPLHYAIREKNCTFAYFLLQNGADPDVKSKLTDDTPLHVATKNEDVRLITLLMKFKANINIENSVNQTPLDIATNINNQDIIEMFEPKFESFIHAHNPTMREYGSIKKANITKYNNNNSKEIKSAFHINGNTLRKKRKIWRPKSMKHVHINDNDSDSSTDSECNDGNLSDYSTSSDDSSDDEYSGKISKMLGESKENIKKKNEFDVSDIIKDLKCTRDKPKQVVKVIERIDIKHEKLPFLACWLEKRRTKPPYFYAKRFLCIVDEHLLWNDKKIKLYPHSKLDKTEKKKYKGAMSLLIVEEVKIKTYKGYPDWYEFEIIVPNGKLGGNKKQSYNWRCKTKKIRDDWIKGIKLYKRRLRHDLKELDLI